MNPEPTPFLESLGSNTLVITVLTLALLILATRINRTVLDKLAEKYASRRILIKNFIPLINLALNLGAALFLLLGVLRVSTDNLLAFGVSAGVAIGFAIQDLLANIFAGLVIVFTRPFNIGDKIQAGSHYGEVLQVSLLRVKIVTPDDSQINIPSKTFLQEPVSNANTGELNCQVVSEIKLPGYLDQALVRRVAREAAYASGMTLLSKPVTVILQDDFQNRSLLKVKVKSYVADHRWEFRYSSEIYQRIKRALEKEIGSEFYRPGSSE